MYIHFEIGASCEQLHKMTFFFWILLLISSDLFLNRNVVVIGRLKSALSDVEVIFDNFYGVLPNFEEVEAKISRSKKTNIYNSIFIF